MRTAILTVALLASLVLPGRLPLRPRPRPRVRPAAHAAGHRPPLHHPVSWKAVAAGGAAFSGAVFAYKVSDGIQKGTVEVARTHPEAFVRSSEDADCTVRIASGISALLIVAYLIWLLLSRRRKPPAG